MRGRLLLPTSLLSRVAYPHKVQEKRGGGEEEEQGGELLSSHRDLGRLHGGGALVVVLDLLRVRRVVLIETLLDHRHRLHHHLDRVDGLGGFFFQFKTSRDGIGGGEAEKKTWREGDR